MLSILHAGFYSLFQARSLLASLTMIYVIYLQWLVKRAIERKEEMGDYIREFSVSQFNKFHTTPKVKYLGL